MNAMFVFGLVVLLSRVSCAVDADVTPRLCQWLQPRAAVVRDTLYLDGGVMATYNWNGSGWVENSMVTTVSQAEGLLYTLSFNKSFSVTDNFTVLFEPLQLSGGSSDNPTYRDGFMFADYYEFYTYGGMAELSYAGTDLINDQIFKPEGNIPSTPTTWNPEVNTHYLPTNNVSRNITHGAGVNIPSEYLGFYFSGLQLPSGGFIEDNVEDVSDMPTYLSQQMIKIDMSEMGSASWTNLSINASVSGRGSAQLPWIPFGQQGLLVAIGGVLYPVDAYGFAYPDNSTLEIQSRREGSAFVSEVSVYDVANDEWYNVVTTGDIPPPVADFCAVVAHEEHTQSAQIYIYGGYDGVDLTGNAYDTTFILSVPSFHWTQVNISNTLPKNGRRGHVCTMPYPDQMFVIGGMGTDQDMRFPQGRIIEVMNLTSLEWLDSYDPTKYYNYSIPPAVKSQIPDPNQKAANMDPNLASLFDQMYQIDSLPSIWYPYLPASQGGSSHKWLAPVIGGVCGGVAFAVILFLLWLWKFKNDRKKKPLTSNSGESSTLQSSNHDVGGWVRSQQQQQEDGMHLAKSSISATALEMDSDGHSTVRSSQHIRDPQEVVEIGGAPLLFARGPARSPILPYSPNSPLSGSVEVSGDSKQELQDTSPRQSPKGGTASVITEEPDYNLRNHPLYPHNINDTMSQPDSTIASAIHGLSSVGPDGEPSPPSSNAMSFRAYRLDDFYYNGPESPGPGPRGLRVATESGSQPTRYEPSAGRIVLSAPFSEALPSPQAERPAPIRHDSSTGNDLTAFSEAREPSSIPDSVGAALPLNSGSSAPLPNLTSPATADGPNTPTAPVRPMHQRNPSSMSSGLQLPTYRLPSPDPAEDQRRSAFLENLADPESPQRGGADHPTITAVRRKQVGSPVTEGPPRSAYEENRDRYPDPRA